MRGAMATNLSTLANDGRLRNRQAADIEKPAGPLDRRDGDGTAATAWLGYWTRETDTADLTHHLY